MPLHPQARAFLDGVAAQGLPGWEEMTPDEARSVFNGLAEVFGVGPELPGIEDLTIDGGIPLRIYRPSNVRPLPVVMFFHGGGWVMGNVDTHDTFCRRLACESGATIVAVDYRLAPEHPFPAALDDCLAATRYVAAHAQELGVAADRIAVCGDSAGGNLAAAVAIKARDEGGPPVHSMWLIYPVLAADFETPSYREFAEGHGLTRAAMQWFWDQYAPSATDRANPLAAPGILESLAGLPPTHVLTAECDPLRDAGERFAQRLAAAGVPVTAHRSDGMIHGFAHFTEPFDDGPRAVAELGQAMKAALTS